MSVTNGVWHDAAVDPPTLAGTYIVATENGKVLIGHWYLPRVINGIEYPGKFGGGRGRVTHWMPMPKAPDKRRQEGQECTRA